ncbi:MAG: hypothetical protein RLZZ383_1302 [Pseudomonadota bacterium]|jgi:hypothetical protein
MRGWMLIVGLGMALAGCGAVAGASEGVAGDAAGGKASKASWSTFGATFDASAPVVPVKDVLDAPAAYVGKSVTVQGAVADVCQKAGCWMVLGDGARTIRVRMADHAFSVEKQGAGWTAQVQGEVVAKPLDAAMVEHLRSESAKPDAMPEAAAASGTVYELVASAVRMKP